MDDGGKTWNLLMGLKVGRKKQDKNINEKEQVKTRVIIWPTKIIVILLVIEPNRYQVLDTIVQKTFGNSINDYHAGKQYKAGWACYLFKNSGNNFH